MLKLIRKFKIYSIKIAYVKNIMNIKITLFLSPLAIFYFEFNFSRTMNDF